MGGKGGVEVPENPYEQQLASMASQLWNSTDPVRKGLLDQYTAMMGGNYDPSASPLYAPQFMAAKRGIEDQYGMARDQILAQTARGGGQTGALAKLAEGRAEQTSALPATLTQNIMADMLNKSYGAAFNAPQSAMGGLSSAASSFGNRAMAEAQAEAQNNAMLGQLGMSLGLMAATGGFPGLGAKGAGTAAAAGGSMLPSTAYNLAGMFG